MIFRRFGVPAVAVAVAVAMALLSAGCSSGGTRGASTAAVEKHNLTVAVVPAADSAGVYIAQQRGLFAAQGLHVSIVPVTSSATAIANQVAGHYDVTLGNYVSYILAEATGEAKLRILAEASLMSQHCQAVLTLPGSPIKTIADLKGKTVGVNVPDNIGTILVSSVLEDHAIKPSAVRLVPVPFPQMAAALKAHRIDAAWMPEPFVSSAQLTIGAHELFDADSGAIANLPIAGYVVTQAWAKRYPKTAAAFSRAIVQAQEIADTSRAAVEKAMMTYTGVSHVIAAIMAIDSYPLRVDPVRLQRVADAMLRFGLLKRPFKVKNMTS